MELSSPERTKTSPAIASARALPLTVALPVAEYRPKKGPRAERFRLISEMAVDQVFSPVVVLEMRMPGTDRPPAPVPCRADAVAYRWAARSSAE